MSVGLFFLISFRQEFFVWVPGVLDSSCIVLGELRSICPFHGEVSLIISTGEGGKFLYAKIIFNHE